MARLSRLPTPEVIRSLGDVIDFYESAGQIIARKMPRKKTGIFVSAIEHSLRSVFGATLHDISSVDLSVRSAALSLAGKSGWTWRDAVVSSFYGKVAFRNGTEVAYRLTSTPPSYGVLVTSMSFSEDVD